MDPTKPNFGNNLNLTQNVIPITDIEKIKQQERERMFSFLPVLRGQGRIPNREINNILSQSKMALNTDPVYNKVQSKPQKFYSLNFFPNNK